MTKLRGAGVSAIGLIVLVAALISGDIFSIILSIPLLISGLWLYQLDGRTIQRASDVSAQMDSDDAERKAAHDS